MQDEFETRSGQRVAWSGVESLLIVQRGAIAHKIFKTAISNDENGVTKGDKDSRQCKY